MHGWIVYLRFSVVLGVKLCFCEQLSSRPQTSDRSACVSPHVSCLLRVLCSVVSPPHVCASPSLLLASDFWFHTDMIIKDACCEFGVLTFMETRSVAQHVICPGGVPCTRRRMCVRGFGTGCSIYICRVLLVRCVSSLTLPG